MKQKILVELKWEGQEALEEQTGEKAKDFKQAVKRLLKELKGYKVLIIISLILAIVGAVLSISAPNKLSELTDEIQKGLIIQAMDLDKIKAIAIFLVMLYSASAIFYIYTRNLHDKCCKLFCKEA